MKKLDLLAIALTALLLPGSIAIGQNFSGIPGATPIQSGTPFYSTIPISATAAVATQTTLTIPAPATGFFNYVCYLGFDVSENGSVTANTNQVTTSTNFNAFALKYSFPGTANGTYDWSAHWGTPAGGCVKSAQAGTATTFVSPAALTNSAFTWYATYYQAP